MAIKRYNATLRNLEYRLRAFKAIKLSTEGIDRVCLPCKNNGVKYRTI